MPGGVEVTVPLPVPSVCTVIVKTRTSTTRYGDGTIQAGRRLEADRNHLAAGWIRDRYGCARGNRYAWSCDLDLDARNFLHGLRPRRIGTRQPPVDQSHQSGCDRRVLRLPGIDDQRQIDGDGVII